MPFTLRVSFHGMCMFVRDGTEKLHVLMPATGGDASTGGDGCDCVEAHAPRLLFDSAHLRPNQTAADDATVHVSLQKKKLEFPTGGNALDATLPTELAKIGHVRDDVVTGENTELLNSRVLLRSGSCSDYAKGTCWTWQGQAQRLSHIIEWTVENVPGDSLSLPLVGLTGIAMGTLPTLHPVDGVVELEVWHAPHTELPPDSIVPPRPSRSGPAQHFSAFGKLLVTGSTDVPAYEPDACPEIVNPGKYDHGDKSAATWSCTSSEGEYP
jgi:hypothetical protein